MLKLLGISLIFAVNSYAFTLSTASTYKFPGTEITVNVSDTACTYTTPTDLLAIASDAITQYWNQVPTTKLKFKKGGIVSSDTTGTSAAYVAGQSGTNAILIGCNSDHASLSGTTLAIGFFTGLNGKITGAGILVNDTASTAYDTLSKDKKVSTIAHELGHAFGLGHSTIKESLMYYQVIPTREKLGQDDYDAITFLYPTEKKLGGLMGSCGTVSLINKDDDNDEDPRASLFANLLLGFGITLLLFRSKVLKGLFSVQYRYY